MSVKNRTAKRHQHFHPGKNVCITSHTCLFIVATLPLIQKFCQLRKTGPLHIITASSICRGTAHAFLVACLRICTKSVSCFFPKAAVKLERPLLLQRTLFPAHQASSFIRSMTSLILNAVRCTMNRLCSLLREY